MIRGNVSLWIVGPPEVYEEGKLVMEHGSAFGFIIKPNFLSLLNPKTDIIMQTLYVRIKRSLKAASDDPLKMEVYADRLYYQHPTL